MEKAIWISFASVIILSMLCGTGCGGAECSDVTAYQYDASNGCRLAGDEIDLGCYESREQGNLSFSCYYHPERQLLIWESVDTLSIRLAASENEFQECSAKTWEDLERGISERPFCSEQ
jgi:hypothetical protein